MRRAFTAAVIAVVTVLLAPAPAGALDQITAEQAFDAVQMQVDPLSGEPASVALVDVRSRAEWFWVGAAAEVLEIELDTGSVLIPDLGKVKIAGNGRVLAFEVSGHRRVVPIRRVASVSLQPIAFSVPFRLWDEAAGTLPSTVNPDFDPTIAALAEDYDVLIIFCRSGGRTNTCAQPNEALFDAVYEIDQPNGTSGRGGMEGTSYSNVYNGYRGYPGRVTRFQDDPSVAWKDAGLPIVTSTNPLDFAP